MAERRDADHYQHVLRPLKQLHPNEFNPRRHGRAQLKKIEESIAEFGFTQPLLIDEADKIIAGHGRFTVANRMDFEVLPCILVSGLSEHQKKALAIADNQLGLISSWDSELLAASLEALAKESFQLSTLGFSPQELTRLLNPSERANVMPEPDYPKVFKPGMIYRLGRHRLICGDARDAAVVKALLEGRVPNLMVTDPPYGVNYDPSWRNDAIGWSGSHIPIGGRAMGVVTNDDIADWQAAWKHFPGHVSYVWSGDVTSHIAVGALIASGFVIRSQIVWNKNSLVIGRGHYHQKHEIAFYAVRKGKGAKWIGGRKQSSVWDIDKPMISETGHSTQKPVECMRRPIINHDSEFVYEPFAGSGTTLIASELAERTCLAIELEPRYCDLILQRWIDNYSDADVEQVDG